MNRLEAIVPSHLGLSGNFQHQILSHWSPQPRPLSRRPAPCPSTPPLRRCPASAQRSRPCPKAPRLHRCASPTRTPRLAQTPGILSCAPAVVVLAQAQSLCVAVPGCVNFAHQDQGIPWEAEGSRHGEAAGAAVVQPFPSVAFLFFWNTRDLRLKQSHPR